MPDDTLLTPQEHIRISMEAAATAAAAITPAFLEGMTHDPLQAMQWELDEAVQTLQTAKLLVHDAREREYLKNRPPASPNAQIVRFGGGSLPTLLSQWHELDDTTAKLEGKLGDESFLSRAPGEVVDLMRSKLQECKAQLQKLVDAIKNMGGQK